MYGSLGLRPRSRKLSGSIFLEGDMAGMPMPRSTLLCVPTTSPLSLRTNLSWKVVGMMLFRQKEPSSASSGVCSRWSCSPSWSSVLPSSGTGSEEWRGGDISLAKLRMCTACSAAIVSICSTPGTVRSGIDLTLLCACTAAMFPSRDARPARLSLASSPASSSPFRLATGCMAPRGSPRFRGTHSERSQQILPSIAAVSESVSVRALRRGYWPRREQAWRCRSSARSRFSFWGGLGAEKAGRFFFRTSRGLNHGNLVLFLVDFSIFQSGRSWNIHFPVVLCAVPSAGSNVPTTCLRCGLYR